MSFKNIKPLGGRPAGQPTSPGGQQPARGNLLEPIVTNSRDQRVLDWLVSQVGQEAVLGAITNLSGARQPFPSNIAKILGITVPKDLAIAPKDEVLERVGDLKRILASTKRR